MYVPIQKVRGLEAWNSTAKELDYSKHFLDSLGHEGLNNLLAAYEDKFAVAICTFAFSSGPGAEPILFQGRTEV
jgi:hypothetical protein